MKTIVSILHCNCGNSTIILNDNYENFDFDDVEDDRPCCPVCGDDFEGESSREIDIEMITTKKRGVQA